MKNLTNLILATVTVIASTSILNAQGYSAVQNGGVNSTVSPYSNSTNPSNYQPQTGNYQSQAGLNNAQQNQNQWGNQNPQTNSENTLNQNQANSTQDQNKSYTQPSNVPSSLNSSASNSNGQKLASLTDENISQKIRWAVRDDKNMSKIGKNAEITVKSGSVTLSGNVESNEEKNRIAEIARETFGVKSVSNNLNINNNN